MLVIDSITSDNDQEFTIPFQESEIVLRVRFLPAVQQWFMDVSYNGIETNGVKLAVEVLPLFGRNYPFDIWIVDNSGTGLDPFTIDDFSNGRCEMYLLEPSDMTDIRGFEVAL